MAKDCFNCESRWDSQKTLIEEAIKTGSKDSNHAQIAVLEKIEEKLDDVVTVLLAAAVGKDHVPTSIVKTLHRMYGIIIVGLMGILAAVLTGQSFGYLVPKSIQQLLDK